MPAEPVSAVGQLTALDQEHDLTTPVRILRSSFAGQGVRITSKGQVTIPQEIREQCGLLPHTQVRFVVEDGRVLIEKDSVAGSRGMEGLERLRRERLRTLLSTDELLALTR